MKRRPSILAFTLIELLLALVVIAMALSIAAPAVSGWGRGSRLRDAGDEFFATIRWAQTQAISSSQIYRLNVDAANGRYWVTAQDGLEYVPLNTEHGRETFVPTGTALQVTSGAEARPVEFITFYPTGRTTPAHVRISDDRGQVNIVCETPAEGFRMLKPGEVVQP